MIDFIPPAIVHEYVVDCAPLVACSDSLQPHRIWMHEYEAPDFTLPNIELHVDIQTDKTIVTSTLYLKRTGKHSKSLALDGENLELLEVVINGNALDQSDYILLPEKLIITNLPQDETLQVQTKVAIYPEKNLALQGLYASQSTYCTQCEPQGFRHITYSLDRSDVLSKYTTTIVADQERFPILLSNGNLIAAETLPEGRHSATWEDPFAKPTYLFALIAGNFSIVQDTFTTQSGRDVTLQIYVDAGNEFRATFALESLKKAMRWDEETFGREYDLDNLKIVAIADFNQGAMENKGLLVFNSFQVLASPDTTTDPVIQQIERVVGHEYFHNWSGNRVTIRDWFQLTLKEGLTSYREQEFSAAMNSRAVNRIQDVSKLRRHQFTEDASPHAHPVQPASYVKIDNFYTSTVYNKGAELYRMLNTLLGQETFRKGMDIFFSDYDGQAVTTEEYMQAMEKASGQDLSQFRNWFFQAGTPEVYVSMRYDESAQEVILTVKQTCPATPECQEKKPFYFPLSLGFLDQQGSDLLSKDAFIVISQPEEEFRFSGITEKVTLSLLRNFSAPVKLYYEYTVDELEFLFLYDSDLFNRWDAGRRLSQHVIKNMLSDYENQRDFQYDERLIAAYRKMLSDTDLDAAFRAETLKMPTLTDIIEHMSEVDIDAACAVQSAFEHYVAKELENDFVHTERKERANTAGSRALRAICLDYLSSLNDKHVCLLSEQFAQATNMTDSVNALRLLCDHQGVESQHAKISFYNKWKNDPIVMNYWFSAQARSKQPNLLQEIVKLETNTAFDPHNPNKIRQLYGSFVNNLRAFHDQSGQGYQFVVNRLLEIDCYNSFMAAELAKGFHLFPRLKSEQKTIMRKELERILANPECSENVKEVVSQILGD